MPRRAGVQKGTLRKRNGSWVGQWNVRVYDGKRLKWRWVGKSAMISPLKKISENGRLVNVKESEAQAIFHETILSKLDIGSTSPQALGTVREFWERKLQPEVAEGGRRKTLEDWATVMDLYILPTMGAKQVRHVRPEDCESVILLARRKGKGRTAEKLYTRMGTFFRRAKQCGWYSGELPTEAIRAPKHTPEERATLTQDQLMLLIPALPSPAREIVMVLSMTGLRIGELQGLRWKRVNTSDEPMLSDGRTIQPRSLQVREAYVAVHGKNIPEEMRGGRYQELKTKNGRRDIPLADPLVQLLRDLRGDAGPGDPVFPNPARYKDKPVNANALLKKQLKPVLESLGLPAVTWHGLRHTQATLADEGGMPTGQRRLILGHGNSAMTDHYTHANLEQARPYMEAMAERFAGLLKRPTPQNVVEIKRKVG